MSNRDDSWMPTPARRSVIVGTSLARALNARKSKGTAPAPKPLHPRDFYSFRYNFRPPSVDPGGRGRIIVKKGQDSTSVIVERPSTQPSEAHQWQGSEDIAKEWDCVLIYDEISDTYTLEKLDSNVRLNNHQRNVIAIEPSALTPPTQSPTKPSLSYEAQLDKELAEAAALDEDKDADGEDEFEEIIPKSIKIEAQKQEEEEEEIFVPPPPPPPAKSKPPRTAKHIPPAPPAPAPAPAPAPVAPPPTTKSRQTTATTSTASSGRTKAATNSTRGKKHKRELEPSSSLHDLTGADAEDLEFGVPAKRARTSLPSPSAPTSAGSALALPGSTSVYAPPPPPSITFTPPEAENNEVGSESEEEWDVVAAVDGATASAQAANAGGGADTEDDFDIFGDALGGDKDIDDMDELEREINMELGADGSDGEGDGDGDEDFLEAVETATPVQMGLPVSLKELANGAGETYASDDDYTTSEDSDDD